MCDSQFPSTPHKRAKNGFTLVFGCNARLQRMCSFQAAQLHLPRAAATSHGRNYLVEPIARPGMHAIGAAEASRVVELASPPFAGPRGIWRGEVVSQTFGLWSPVLAQPSVLHPQASPLHDMPA